MKDEKDFVDEAVINILGKEGLSLLELLRGKANVSEFKISDKLKITVNAVRHLLYKLVSHNLVSFTRKKDKKKGWYIYYWTLDEKEAEAMAIKLKKQKLEQLRKRLEKESSTDYLVCPNKCMRLSLESAMDYDFKCPECGNILEREKEGFSEKIKKEIMQIEEEIRKHETEKAIREEIKEKKAKVKKKVKPKKFKKKAKINKIIKKKFNKKKVKSKKVKLKKKIKKKRK